MSVRRIYQHFCMVLAVGFLLLLSKAFFKDDPGTQELSLFAGPNSTFKVNIRKFVGREKLSSFQNKTSSLKPQPIFNISQLEIVSPFFYKIGNHTCFFEGTKSINRIGGCQCTEEYFGRWCSFPIVLKSMKSFDVNSLAPRAKPRRVVYGSPFNNEFPMLEARLTELADAVEIFIYSESNYTGHGDSKNLTLFNKLQCGYLKDVKHRFIHAFSGHFPKGGQENGWIADDWMRNVISEAMEERVVGLRHDDLFLLTDADELPNRQAVLFLKLHDGYPEPIGIHLDWRVYGFFWQVKRPLVISFAGTFGLLWHVLRNKAIRLRNPNENIHLNSSELRSYLKSGAFVKYWHLGLPEHTMGWHCSWCTTPAGIRGKMLAAINADFPRWGNYPEKTKLEYIKSLVKTGKWFDDKSFNLKLEPDIARTYAPGFLLRNWKKYHHLLVNPYQ